MAAAAGTYWPVADTGPRAVAQAAFSVAASRRRPTGTVAATADAVAVDIRGGMWLQLRRWWRRRASNSARNKSATAAAVALRLRAVPPGTCSST